MSEKITRKLVAEQWASYRKILPPNASTVQIIETRRAFYAGANGLMATVLNLLEPGQDATDADLKMMDDIQEEFKEFADLIKAGVA